MRLNKTNNKDVVAVIEYFEYLPTGEIKLGSKFYENGFSPILEQLGFSREEFTYTYEEDLDNAGVEDMITRNKLYILKKDSSCE